MDVGVRDAGFEVMLANDVDPVACATYRLNHGGVVFEGSVSDLMPLLKRVSDVDLLFGGPPCQGFSVAGKMNPDDPRSTLMGAFFDAVDTVRPRAFICENVKALATLSRWSGTRAELLERANRDYHASLIVLNASEFGVPQNRDRMFIVGVRQDLFKRTRAEFAAALQAEIEGRRSKAPTVGQVIRKLGPAGSPANRRVCRAKITFAKCPVMRRSAYAGMLFNGAGRPLPPNGIAPTLPASMGGNKTPIVDEEQIFRGSRSVVETYHRELTQGATPRSGTAPKALRRLTVDECLAIQTFPPGYKLAGAQSAMYRQIGNAVPCKLAEAVASSVRALLAECGGEGADSLADRGDTAIPSMVALA
jgi:DNA (cytosine-5)-methyltransferase 1